MKKLYLFAAAIIISGAIACNNSSDNSNTPTATTAPDNTAKDNNTTPPANEPEGLTLMSKSDCNNCHNATTKVVGPSYKDIAAKYPNTPENTAKLTDEVMKGVNGIWSSVPMPPHPALQKTDAEKMVAYILSKDEK